MGFFDLFSGDEPDSTRDDETAAEDPVIQYYFVGNEIGMDPLNEAMLVLTYYPEPDTGDESDEWTWSVVKCNESLEVPADLDLQVCVYRDGSVISSGDRFQSHMAWLLTSEQLESLERDDAILRTFPFPESLREITIAEGTKWAEDDLKPLCLPFDLENADPIEAPAEFDF